MTVLNCIDGIKPSVDGDSLIDLKKTNKKLNQIINSDDDEIDIDQGKHDIPKTNVTISLTKLNNTTVGGKGW